MRKDLLEYELNALFVSREILNYRLTLKETWVYITLCEMSRNKPDNVVNRSFRDIGSMAGVTEKFVKEAILKFSKLKLVKILKDNSQSEHKVKSGKWLYQVLSPKEWSEPLRKSSASIEEIKVVQIFFYNGKLARLSPELKTVLSYFWGKITPDGSFPTKPNDDGDEIFGVSQVTYWDKLKQLIAHHIIVDLAIPELKHGDRVFQITEPATWFRAKDAEEIKRKNEKLKALFLNQPLEIKRKRRERMLELQEQVRKKNSQGDDAIHPLSFNNQPKDVLELAEAEGLLVGLSKISDANYQKWKDGKYISEDQMKLIIAEVIEPVQELTLAQSRAFRRVELKKTLEKENITMSEREIDDFLTAQEEDIEKAVLKLSDEKEILAPSVPRAKSRKQITVETIIDSKKGQEALAKVDKTDTKYLDRKLKELDAGPRPEINPKTGRPTRYSLQHYNGDMVYILEKEQEAKDIAKQIENGELDVKKYGQYFKFPYTLAWHTDKVEKVAEKVAFAITKYDFFILNEFIEDVAKIAIKQLLLLDRQDVLKEYKYDYHSLAKIRDIINHFESEKFMSMELKFIKNYVKRYDVLDWHYSQKGQLPRLRIGWDLLGDE